jgi:poly(3-hydroxyalkanoate) synthetase
MREVEVREETTLNDETQVSTGHYCVGGTFYVSVDIL